MIKKKNTVSTITNNDYVSNFHDKLTNVMIRVATIGIVPILLIGSFFYFKTGFIIFGIIEILISAVILIIVSINRISNQNKQSAILVTLYYTSIFILLTTGNSGAGIGSMLTVIMLFSIVSRKSKNYTLFYINLITISIITIPLYLGYFDSLEIFVLKQSWPFLYLILNAYSFVFIFVFENYKNEFQKTQLLLKASIESFNDLIVLSIDHNYCYLYFNKAHKDTMIKLYNVEIEIGKSILDYIVDVDDRNNSKINYDKALLGKYHSTIENIKGENQSIDFEASYSPICDDKGEIMPTSQDYTARVIGVNGEINEKSIFSVSEIKQNDSLAQLSCLDELFDFVTSYLITAPFWYNFHAYFWRTHAGTDPSNRTTGSYAFCHMACGLSHHCLNPLVNHGGKYSEYQ